MGIVTLKFRKGNFVFNGFGPSNERKTLGGKELNECIEGLGGIRC